MISTTGWVLVSAAVALAAVGGPLRSECSAERSVTLMEWDKAVVRIDRDCRAEPETVVLDRPGPWAPGKRFETL